MYGQMFFGRVGSVGPLVHSMVLMGALGYYLEYDHIIRACAAGEGRAEWCRSSSRVRPPRRVQGQPAVVQQVQEGQAGTLGAARGRRFFGTERV